MYAEEYKKVTILGCINAEWSMYAEEYERVTMLGCINAEWSVYVCGGIWEQLMKVIKPRGMYANNLQT